MDNFMRLAGGEKGLVEKQAVLRAAQERATAIKDEAIGNGMGYGETVVRRNGKKIPVALRTTWRK